MVLKKFSSNEIEKKYELKKKNNDRKKIYKNNLQKKTKKKFLPYKVNTTSKNQRELN